MQEAQPYRKHRSPERRAQSIDRARELRQSATEAEQSAWSLLRTLRSRGLIFRRQAPVGMYFVDFYCAQRRLIVELDGSVHTQPSQARHDQRRDAYLKSLGFTVARFPNGMVLQAPEVFVQKVRELAWSLAREYPSRL